MASAVLLFLEVIALMCCADIAEQFSVPDIDLDAIGPYEPQQIHLAIGRNQSEIVVTWSTWQNFGTPFVLCGDGDTNHMTEGYSTLFTDEGSLHRQQYIHRVTLSNLAPSSTYYYQCGSEFELSNQFWFKTSPQGEDWSPNLLVYGDLGLANSQCVEALTKEVMSKKYDAVLHVGDFAYNFDSDNGKIGDKFMNLIQPIAAHILFMTCPGNHERNAGFNHYKQRFSMPGDTQSLYYSWNLGPVHFVAVDTEVHYYDLPRLPQQYEWLQSDLKEAAAPESRASRPWIITYGHRPMYCSNNTPTRDCTRKECRVRRGVAMYPGMGLEELFHRFGVDLEFWGHQHSYERTWPVYDYEVFNGSMTERYVNPGAPVHITSGSAGNYERKTPFAKKVPLWSAARSNDYGYSRMQIHNKTHISIEFYSKEQGKVIDSFWLIKDRDEQTQLQDNPDIRDL